MKTNKGIFQMQIRRLFSRTEFKIAWLLCMIFVVMAYIEACLSVWGEDQSNLFSAATGWIGNVNIFSGNVMQLFYFFGISIIAALPFSDSFLEDKLSRSLPAVLVRGTWKSYLTSGLFLTFFSGFLVILIPLLLSQILALLIFPVNGDLPMGIWGSGAWTSLSTTDTYVFPSLVLNYPYLNNMVFIFYSSIFAGLNAVASYILSLLGIRRKLFVLCIPTIFWLLYSAVITFVNNTITPYIYLYPNDSVYKEVWFFFILPLTLLVFIWLGYIIVQKRNMEAIL